MRAPSSFHSTAAGVNRSSAAPTSSADCASMGCSGRSTSSRNDASPASPPRHCGCGDRAEVAAEHRRAPHRRERDARRPRDRVGHHALERALAQPAEQERAQELCSGRGRAAEEVGDELAPPRLRPGAGRLADSAQRRIDLEQRERRRGRGRRQLAQRRPPHADRRVRQLARQVRDRDGHLVRAGLPQARGEGVDLREPGRRRRDRGRSACDLLKQHPKSMIAGRSRGFILGASRRLRVATETVEAKTAVLEAAVARAREHAGADAEDVERFVRAYYAHVAPEELAGRSDVDVAGAALAHRQLAAVRRPGETKVHVYTPSAEEHGWESPHTVVQTVSTTCRSSSTRSRWR
jgi:hypothetical protein